MFSRSLVRSETIDRKPGAGASEPVPDPIPGPGSVGESVVAPVSGRWSGSAVGVAIEDDSRGTIDTYTRALLTGLEGQLGRHSTVKYGSLSCGHTNRFLCAALDAADCCTRT